MEIYETDEEQVAAIKRWWKENGTSTISGIVGGILIIGGWNYWQSYQQDKYLQAASLYEQLLVDISEENNESIQKITEQISTEHGSTAYASYAALLLAKTKVQAGDLEAAKTILQKQMNGADSSQLRNVARLRLARLMYASGDNEKGLQLIAEADQTSIEGFVASYDELKGDLYVALDRLSEARTAYGSAVREGSGSALLQFKLDDITVADIVESTESSLDEVERNQGITE